MQKIRISRIFSLICLVILLMLSFVAEAMVWDTGYGVEMGEPGPQRMIMTFRNARSVVFILGFFTLFVLLILSFFKKIRKKCLIFSGILTFLLLAVATAGQVIDYATSVDVTDPILSEGTLITQLNYEPESSTTSPLPVAKPEPTLCEIVEFDRSFSETEFIDRINSVSRNNLSNIRCERDETLLSRCVYKGWDKAVELLLAKGADVNARGYNGNTALHWAFLKLKNEWKCYYAADCRERLSRYLKIVDALINNGASRKLKNTSGKVPEEMEYEYKVGF